MRKSLFGSIERLDARLKCSLRYDELLVDKRNSVFVLLTLLLMATVVPSAVGLVSCPSVCSGKSKGLKKAF
jgi:hypothetical protein